MNMWAREYVQLLVHCERLHDHEFTTSQTMGQSVRLNSQQRALFQVIAHAPTSLQRKIPHVSILADTNG